MKITECERGHNDTSGEAIAWLAIRWRRMVRSGRFRGFCGRRIALAARGMPFVSLANWRLPVPS